MRSEHTQRGFKALLIGIFVVGILLASREHALQPDGKLHVHMLDVGQGDSILLQSPSGKQVLVDGGPDHSVLESLGRLLPFFDRRIEFVIVTHPEADHITGLSAVLRHYDVGAILLTGIDHSSMRYDAFLRSLLTRDIPLISPDPIEDIDLGDGLIVDILWPSSKMLGSAVKNPNNTSIVLRALFGDTSILLTGDIEEEAEMAILQRGDVVKANILKVPHHGSRTSSSTGFLLATKPSLAMISVGKNNSYGHPHREVLSRYRDLGIDLKTTAENGLISLTFP